MPRARMQFILACVLQIVVSSRQSFRARTYSFPLCFCFSGEDGMRMKPVKAGLALLLFLSMAGPATFVFEGEFPI